MAIQPQSAHLHSWWQSSGTALLVIVLFLVLIAAMMFAARTPWVLDQPLPPYDWAIVR